MIHPVCPFCDEPVLPGETAGKAHIARPGGGEVVPAHPECVIRQAVGGVNHQLGRCCCPGCDGDLPPDPEGVSRREAARQAVALFRRRRER